MEIRLRVIEDERGASLVEYALLVALIFIVCVVSVQIIGGETGGSLSRSGSSVASAVSN